MAIVLDGNLGITTPAETVQGALTTTGNTILGDASTDTLNVGNGGLVKDASGNVGIGVSSVTTSGSRRSLQITNGASGGIILLGNAATENPNPRIFLENTYDLGLASGVTTGVIKCYTNDTERMRIDSSGNLLFNSGYGSAATAYGCRAWVNFNGQGTVSIRASGNVSSITDNNVGDYTVNFTTAMVDVNYAISGFAVFSTATPAGILTAGSSFSPAVGSVRILSANSTSGATIDSQYVSVSVFR